MVRRLLRIGTSALFLCALVWLLDAEALATRLAALRPRWALLAVGLSVPQMALMAFRWRLTAGRLGLDLPFGVALREYYLATFLNQVLPGSVMGDASRAWRHTRAGDGAPVGPVLRAVILERASGQAVMAATAALSLASMPLAFAIAPRSLLLLGAGICGATVLFAFLVRRRLPSLGPLASEWEDVHKALLARDVFPLQLATSALVVASLLAMYVVAAKAIGVDTPVMTLLPLVAPVLMSMLIPGTVAGLGDPRGHRRRRVGRGRTHRRRRSSDLRRLRGGGIDLDSARGTRAPHLKSRSNSRSSPRRTCRQRGRSASARVSIGGNVSAGLPEPISRGATVTCNRSSSPA